jgi:hypothetical protein
MQVVAIIFAVLLALLAAPVRAQVVCNATPSNLLFGTINTTGPDRTADALLTISCQVIAVPPIGGTVSAAISISGGNSGTNFSNRFMSMTAGSVSGTLQYNIYPNSLRVGQPWGNGSNGSAVVSQVVSGLNAAGNSSQVNVTLYGKVPGPQSSILSVKPAGLYRDPGLIVTITW